MKLFVSSALISLLPAGVFANVVPSSVLSSAWTHNATITPSSYIPATTWSSGPINTTYVYYPSVTSAVAAPTCIVLVSATAHPTTVALNATSSSLVVGFRPKARSPENWGTTASPPSPEGTTSSTFIHRPVSSTFAPINGTVSWPTTTVYATVSSSAGQVTTVYATPLPEGTSIPICGDYNATSVVIPPSSSSAPATTKGAQNNNSDQSLNSQSGDGNGTSGAFSLSTNAVAVVLSSVIGVFFFA